MNNRSGAFVLLAYYSVYDSVKDEIYIDDIKFIRKKCPVPVVHIAISAGKSLLKNEKVAS